MRYVALLLLQAVISVRTELVTVPVTVTGPRGVHVSGLGRDDSRVYEDGRLRPIEVFHHGDSPVTLGLIVDRSGSARPQGAVLQAAVSAYRKIEVRVSATGHGQLRVRARPGYVVAP